MITRRFSHLPGKLSSLHFSPTKNYLTAEFKEDDGKRLDKQQMVSLNIVDKLLDIPPTVIHSSRTNRVFAPQDYTRGNMGGINDRLKYDLRNRAAERSVDKQYLSIARWPQAFGGKFWWNCEDVEPGGFREQSACRSR